MSRQDFEAFDTLPVRDISVVEFLNSSCDIQKVEDSPDRVVLARVRVVFVGFPEQSSSSIITHIA